VGNNNMRGVSMHHLGSSGMSSGLGSIGRALAFHKSADFLMLSLFLRFCSFALFPFFFFFFFPRSPSFSPSFSFYFSTTMEL
jgi:hypothetical protein